MEQETSLRLTDQNPLGFEPTGKLLMRFAVPAVVSMVVNSLYNIVDQIFIGQGVGYLGNGATTVVNPMVTIAIGFGTLIGAGGSAYASIKLGEKRVDVAETVLGNVVTLSTVIGLLFFLLGTLFLTPILNLFGSTPEILPYAKDYASIILIGIPFQMVGIGLSNLARTDGSPKVAMIGMLIGAVLNTILDPIYIFVFHWGVKGAAIATITSQIISFIVLIYYFVKRGNMRLRKSCLKPHWRLDLEFCALGISSFITQCTITVLQVVLNNSLVYYGNLTSVGGNVALSAMGVVQKINMILVSICIGVGTGAQPILGFNRGARKWKRVRDTYLQGVLFATVCAVAGWAACMFIPELLISIFGKDNAAFTEFAVLSMRTFLAAVFVSGFQIVSTSYFQATGQPLKASILSLLRQFLLRIPLIWILPLFFGLNGILYAGPCSDIGAALVVIVFITKEMRKLGVLMQEDGENLPCALAVAEDTEG